jgi:hypothetical protein
MGKRKRISACPLSGKTSIINMGVIKVMGLYCKTFMAVILNLS